MMGPCYNHGYPIKHALEDCDLLKRYLKTEYKLAGKEKLTEPTGNEEKGDALLDPKGYHMIFGGPATYEVKRK